MHERFFASEEYTNETSRCRRDTLLSDKASLCRYFEIRSGMAFHLRAFAITREQQTSDFRLDCDIYRTGGLATTQHLSRYAADECARGRRDWL